MQRVVICADGTWNLREQLDDEPGKARPTNVTKVVQAVHTGHMVLVRANHRAPTLLLWPKAMPRTMVLAGGPLRLPLSVSASEHWKVRGLVPHIV